MPNIIQILPDSLANQIAAGEVIQRPASVIKELVENAIDANATQITINLKDAGRTLIQVLDNGNGMSRDDARLAFERHATSKIKSSDDLFNISTKGFRGEALASIAAVSTVELKTKHINDTIGTHLIIEASKLTKIESENTPTGSNFLVKNLFFNIPARRKFLKSDKTEFNHILTEFYRIALAHSQVSFSIIHNDNIIHKLNSENTKERILNIFDKSLNKQLISINTDAGFVKITGFVGNPEFASKSSSKQYFFVNNRYMKSGYFHKAVSMAYNQLLTSDQKPNYFLYFDIDPTRIDVNIHPTKTEINFDNASSIFQIIIASVRKALTDFDIPPAIDFENTDFINMPSFDKMNEIKIPTTGVNPNYNPFKDTQKTTELSFHSKIIQNKDNHNFEDNVFQTHEVQVQSSKKIIILKEKYLLTPVKSGIMIINIKRALKQVKYEEIFDKVSSKKMSIDTIYPIQVRLSTIEANEFDFFKPELEKIGFVFEKINETAFNITATPPFIKVEDTTELIKNLIKISQLTSVDIENLGQEEITIQILNSYSFNSHNVNNQQEAEELINKLFSCKSHQFTYDNKTIVNILNIEQIDNLF